MAEIWNEAELTRPPLITVEVENAKFVENLQHQMVICLQSHKVENEEFAQTAALLSRLIARRKNSFRRMIGFRTLLKLNSTIARLLRADLPRELELFCGALPDMVFGEKAIAPLPTRNCLDFILARLLTVYHIHKRIQDCSLDAANYFIELMRANNYLDLNIGLIAVLAKLRNLNVIFGNKYVELYNNLLGERQKFPPDKQKSIPIAKKLPAHIDVFHFTQLPDELTSEKNLTLTKEKVIALKKDIPRISKHIDVGTEVKRKDTSTLKPENIFQIDQLKTIDDVNIFLAMENATRKCSLNKSITKRIQNNLWTGAQKIFERKILVGDRKKALNFFRKFLNSNL